LGEHAPLGRRQAPVLRKIGDYPAMGLADARAKARELMAAPDAVAKRAAPPASKFLPLAEEFLAHGRTKRGRVLRAATLRCRRVLLVYAKPLHAKPVQDLRRRDAAALIRAVAAARGETTGMRTRAALSRFFGWLVANDRVEANVVAGTEGYETPKRSRVLSDGRPTIVRSARSGSTRRHADHAADAEQPVLVSRAGDHGAERVALDRPRDVVDQALARLRQRVGRAPPGQRPVPSDPPRILICLIEGPGPGCSTTRGGASRLGWPGLVFERTSISETYDRWPYLSEKRAAHQASARRTSSAAAASPR
jgi:hypothetical protein